MAKSFSMSGESPRIPHLAKEGSELFDLRDDVDDAFTRGEVATRKVTILAPAIKLMRAAPPTLVGAQPNAVLELISLYLRLVVGSEVLAETADNLAVKYVDGSGVAATAAIEMTGFIDQVANVNTKGVPLADVILTDAQGVNTPLVLHNIGDGEFTGNASDDAILEAFVSWKKHSLV